MPVYNRYIPNGNGYTRVAEPDRQPSRSSNQDRRPAAQNRPSSSNVSSPNSHRRQDHSSQQAHSSQQSHSSQQNHAPSKDRPNTGPEAQTRQRQGRSSPTTQGAAHPHQQHAPSPPPNPFFSLSGKESILSGLSALTDMFRLDDLDSGDILLILILLFLFRDGDDIELMITLGLILLLGLGDKNKENADRQDTVGV